MVVRLHRRNNAMSPTGLYQCLAPDASGVTQIISVNIVEGIHDVQYIYVTMRAPHRCDSKVEN